VYAGAGAAVLSNWARAILVVDPTKTPGVFKFIAAKRGQRIGWAERERFYAHSREEGQLLWLPADADQLAVAKAESKRTPEDLLKLVPILDVISQERLIEDAKKIGIGRDKTRAFANTLIDDGKLYTAKIQRPGVKAGVGYSQSPQTECS
jgi:hypothetical protein